jgi:hypothetical protein
MKLLASLPPEAPNQYRKPPAFPIKTRHYPAFTQNGKACVAGVVGVVAFSRCRKMIRRTAWYSTFSQYTMRDYSCKKDEFLVFIK